MIYWATCKYCKNRLLEVCFQDDVMGARCAKCLRTVFEVEDDTLKKIEDKQGKAEKVEELDPLPPLPIKNKPKRVD